jgi:hypothetical protein
MLHPFQLQLPWKNFCKSEFFFRCEFEHVRTVTPLCNVRFYTRIFLQTNRFIYLKTVAFLFKIHKINVENGFLFAKLREFNLLTKVCDGQPKSARGPKCGLL